MDSGQNEPEPEPDNDPEEQDGLELATISLETFEPHVASSFRLPEEDIELRLDEASPIGAAPKPGGRIARQAFSLLFHGPSEPLLDQGVRRVEHDQLGKQDVFLVPVGDAEDGGFLYEAVFT